jgi:hypothetical protein
MDSINPSNNTTGRNCEGKIRPELGRGVSETKHTYLIFFHPSLICRGYYVLELYFADLSSQYIWFRMFHRMHFHDLIMTFT